MINIEGDQKRMNDLQKKCKAILSRITLQKDSELYQGDYQTWEEAESLCGGYGQENIIDKVVESVTKVISGDAKFERDSCLFYENQYEHYLLSYILIAYLQKSDKREEFTVIDWGGSLASVYFQHKEILNSCIPDLKWIVIEQDNYVKKGKEIIDDSRVEFITFDDAMKNYDKMVNKIDFVLMRGVLQYINEWKTIVKKAVSLHPQWIIIDRMVISDKERICIENVSENIYSARYPVRIFTRQMIFDNMTGYEIVEERKSGLGEYDMNEYIGKTVIEHKVFVFRKGE